MEAPSISRLRPGQARVHHLAGVALACALWVFVLRVSPAMAAAADFAGAVMEEAPMAAPTAMSMKDDVERRKESLRAQFQTLRAKLEAAADATSFVDREGLQEEIGVLQRIQRALEQEAAIAQLLTEMASERARLNDELADVRAAGRAGQKEISFLALDRLDDELDAQSGRLATLDASVEFAAEALAQARAALDEAERARRAAQEALETNTEADRGSELENRVSLARLRSQAAAEDLRVREIELANSKLERELLEVRVALLGAKSAQGAQRAQLTEAEVEAQTVQIEAEEFEVSQALAKVRTEMSSGAAVAPGEIERWQRQTRQLRMSLLNQRLQQLSDLKQLWGRRFTLGRGTPAREDLAAWEEQTRKQIERAGNEERLYLARLFELRRPGQGASGEASPEATRSPAEQREIETRIQAYELALANVSSFRRAQERLLRQIEAVTESEPLSERLAVGWRMVKAAWRYEILAVEDRPITVGKIVLGIVLFIAGLYVSAFISRFLGRRVWPRLGLDAGASAALQSLSYYVLVAVLSLLALEVINVPLTLFTFVGGALAIGVGFGSQNLMNNFISGLILLAERPIKVGDLIEIGGIGGVVERIGARSTRLRSHKNTHFLVPNSHFLEKEVVNWTLADDSVKTAVAVNVSFGVSTSLVREILIEAVSNHEKIFTAPGPTVLLKNFAPDGCDFEVHFWMRTRSTMDRWIVESDVRCRIEQLFRERGIPLEAPQRDVHLETSEPLEVHVRRE